MSNGRIYIDWGKTVQIVLILVSTVTLGILHIVDSETVAAVIGLGAGYVFGNGKSVRENLPPAPLIGRRPPEEPDYSEP